MEEKEIKSISGYEINKRYFDEFGRVSGIFILNKEEGVTSHDIVDRLRKYFDTKKIGHAGALDPFATGLMIILVGKCLSLAESFIGMDKEYEAGVLFGVATNSEDPEGDIVDQLNEDIKITKEEIDNAIKKLTPEYRQSIPVFSSAKIKGQKLRSLAREYQSFKIEIRGDNKFVQFFNGDKLMKELQLPSKIVKLYDVEVLETYPIKKIDLAQRINLVRNYDRFSKAGDESRRLNENDINLDSFILANISVSCSKGTYIRQLGVDIGESLDIKIPSMLLTLKRKRIGQFGLDDLFKEEIIIN